MLGVRLRLAFHFNIARHQGAFCIVVIDSTTSKKGKGEVGWDIMKTVNADDLYAKDMADPAYRLAYDSLAGKFELINTLLRARAFAGISQAEVASRMGTTESTISRLESGRTKPNARTLERYAEATGHRLHISLEPTGT